MLKGTDPSVTKKEDDRTDRQKMVAAVGKTVRKNLKVKFRFSFTQVGEILYKIPLPLIDGYIVFELYYKNNLIKTGSIKI